MPDFTHHDLTLINPAFDSPLVDALTELEHLRASFICQLTIFVS